MFHIENKTSKSNNVGYICNFNCQNISIKMTKLLANEVKTLEFHIT